MLKIVKDSVLRVSRSLGYDIVPLREMKERDFSLHLGELLRQLEIDCVLDVGANIGQYHDFLRNKVLYEGTIVSFEPVSHHVACLRERAQADPNWHIEAHALGARDGNLSINVMVSDQFSSFLEPDNSKINDYDGLNVPSRTETVAVKTIDTVAWIARSMRTSSRSKCCRVSRSGCSCMSLMNAWIGVLDPGTLTSRIAWRPPAAASVSRR